MPPNTVDDFPRWLPKPVRQAVPQLESASFTTWLSAGSEDDARRLSRLTRDQRMKVVWGTLDAAKRNDADLVRYLVMAWDLPKRWEGVPNFSPKKFKKRMEAVAERAEELGELLLSSCTGPYHLGEAETGVLELALHAAKRPELQELYADFDKLLHPDVLLSPYFHPVPPFASVLFELAEVARANAALYKKLVACTQAKAAIAHRTYYVRRLSRFVEMSFRKPLEEVVAATTTVALDLREDAVDSEQLHRLMRE